MDKSFEQLEDERRDREMEGVVEADELMRKEDVTPDGNGLIFK